MGELAMQPGMNPPRPAESEDIHTIMNRFQTWAGQQSVNGNDNGHRNSQEEVREIPYDEALRQLRNREGQGKRPAAAAKPAPAVERPVVAAAVPTVSASEDKKATAAVVPVKPSSTIETTPSPAEPESTTPAPRTPATSVAAPAGQVDPAPATKSAPKPKAIPAAKAVTAISLPKVSNKKLLTTLPKKSAAPEPPKAVAAKPAVSPMPAAVHKSASPAKTAASKVQAKGIASAKKASAGKRGKGTTQKTLATRTAAAAPPTSRPKKPAVRLKKPKASAQPKFRQVLAKSIRKPNKHSTAKRAAAERDQRITIRFSAEEQRRLEESASRAGIRLSVWLRQRVLTEQQNHIHPRPALPSARKTKSAAIQTAPPSPPASLFNSPMGWLALLRQRFLTSPVRIAEKA